MRWSVGFVVGLAACFGTANEVCDNGLACAEGSHCDTDLSECVLDSCGNRTLDPGEDCDAEASAIKLCAGLVREVDGMLRTFHSGVLGCRPSCTYDVTSCRYCGDGEVDVTEEICDTAQAPAATCIDLGFDRGALRCSDDCQSLTDDCTMIGWRPTTAAPERYGGLGLLSDGSLLVASDRAVSRVDALRAQTELPATQGLYHAIGAAVPLGMASTPEGFAIVVHNPTNEPIARVRNPRVGTGVVWETLPLGPVETALTDLHIATTDSGYVAYVVGFAGTAFRLENGAVTSLDLGVSVDLSAVWINAADDVYIGGEHLSCLLDSCEETTLLHFDGSGWTSVLTTPNTSIIYDLAGSPGALFVSAIEDLDLLGSPSRVVGGTMEALVPGYRAAGAMWSAHEAFLAMAEFSGADLVWLGDRIEKTSGLAAPGLGGFGNHVVGNPGRPWHLLRAGAGGGVYQFDGTAVGPIDTGPALKAIDLGPDEIVVGGGTGGRLAAHIDGQWQDLCGQAPLPSCPNNTIAITGLVSRGIDDLWFVDTTGTLSSWNGSAATQRTSGSTCLADLGARGDALYATGGPSLCEFDGADWIETPQPGSMLAVWVAGDNDVFAGGRGLMNTGLITRTVDGIVDEYPLPVGDVIIDLWGTIEENLFAVTNRGKLYHFDGAAWELWTTVDPTFVAFALDGTATGELVMLGRLQGASNLVLYYSSNQRDFEAIRLPPLGVAPGNGGTLFITPSVVYLGLEAATTHLRRFIPWDGCRVSEEDCADDVDNDCDGYLDGNDSDCP